MTNDTPKFEPGTWHGDPDELIPHVELLTYDADLCERTFESKMVAFNCGRALGYLAAQAGSDPDAASDKPE